MKKKSQENFFLRKPEKRSPCDETEELKFFYSKNKVPDDLDVIIIGAGIGGLSCAALLTKVRKKVLLLEQFEEIGGLSHSWVDEGYKFQVGMHFVQRIGNIGSKEKILSDFFTDFETEWKKYDSMVKFVLGDKKIEVNFYDEEKFQKELIEKFPHEKKGINTLIGLTRSIREDEEFWCIGITMVPKFLRPFFKLFIAKNFVKYTTVSTLEYLQSIFTDEKLITVLAMFASLINNRIDRLPAATYLFVLGLYLDGSFFPKGGPEKFVRDMAKVIKKNNGTILCKAFVEEILVDNGKAVGVKLRNGDEIRAKHVISANGIQNTYQSLPKYCRPKGIEKVESSLSSCYVFLGFDFPISEIEGFPETNVYISESNIYEHLKVLQNEDSPSIDTVFIGNSNFIDKKEESKFSILLMSFMNNKWFKKWHDMKINQRGRRYEELKRKLTDKMLKIVFSKYPNIEKHIAYLKTGTNCSARYYTNWKDGQSYGIESNEQRILEYSDKYVLHPPVSQLSIAGQDRIFTHGIFPTMLSALFACQPPLKGQFNILMEYGRTKKYFKPKKRFVKKSASKTKFCTYLMGIVVMLVGLLLFWPI